MTLQVHKIDREGWAVFTGECGGLCIGNLRKVDGEYQVGYIWSTCVDTPANRDKAISVWKANSFAREVKV